MKTSRTSSSAILALIIVASGCGGRARTAPPPASDVTRSGGVSTVKDGEKRRPSDDGTVRLPGQDRSYPSEDPRNRPRAGSPGLEPAPTAQSPSTPSQVAPAAPPATGFGGMVFENTPPKAPDLGPPPVPRGESRFRVQILASVVLKTALGARDEVAKAVEEPVFVEREQEIWKVRVGDLRDRAAADGIRRRLIGLGYDDAFVVEAHGR